MTFTDWFNTSWKRTTTCNNLIITLTRIHGISASLPDPLNVLKRRNSRLSLSLPLSHAASHTFWHASLYICALYFEIRIDRGGGRQGVNLSWMSKVRQTACGGFSTDPADVSALLANFQPLKIGHWLPVCQHAAVGRGEGQWSVDGKTQTVRWGDGQDNWSVRTLCACVCVLWDYFESFFLCSSLSLIRKCGYDNNKTLTNL